MKEIFNNMFRPKTNSNYKLTTLGKTKLENANLPEAKLQVMYFISSNEPCSLREIADDTHMSEKRVKNIVGLLKRDGYVATLNTDGG